MNPEFSDSLRPNRILRPLLRNGTPCEALLGNNACQIQVNRGLLTATERAEYAKFVDYIDLVAIFKAKVRVRLARASA